MRRLKGAVLIACMVAGLALARVSGAQDLPLTQQLRTSELTPLDPTRGVPAGTLESAIHQPLPEQYVWTAAAGSASDAIIYSFPGIAEQIEPHFFRAHFQVDRLPPAATLYLAGPRSVSVWINGQLAEKVSSDTSSPLGMHVFATSVAKYLKQGENTVAIEAVRGRGVTGFANSALLKQQTFGQVIVGKIVPAAQGVVAPDLMHSDGSWLSSAARVAGWEQPGFRGADWKPVLSLSGIESNIELYQWNADAGLYDWPGYNGLSPFLAHMPLPVMNVLSTYSGRGGFEGLDSLKTGAGEMRVRLPASQMSDADAPALFLDFGRELTGRLEIVSGSDTPVTMTVQLGESETEALKAPYLGVNQLTIPANGTGHSPKTAFRYARVRFLGGAPELRIKAIRVDHTYLPVEYQGSFESSDPLLNRIWEVGAYTAHLCMQDGVWDASKRDRGRWMGDLDVSGPVIEDVFGETKLMEDTLDRLLGPAPVRQHVNGIPGYSSFWFTGVADFYRHSGDKAFLKREHDRMLQLLQVVDGEFDERGVYANKSKVWLYVDWSPELNGDTPETRRATTLEFVRAFHEAAFMLREVGDTANATKYENRAKQIEAAATKYLLDAKTGTYGPRWQTNAAAVISGTAKAAQYPAIWRDVLSTVGKEPGDSPVQPRIMTPYYGAYVLRAMAKMNHREEALKWMRDYWGGMVNEGATSFWEAYDTSWYKEDFHASLQADNRSGYFVSLAHGWSAGPTAWLTEEVLGIQPTASGFSTVSIRPDLAGLAWAKGAVPTPHGLIKLDARAQGAATALSLDLPDGVVASVSLPGAAAQVKVNGKPMHAMAAEGGRRRVVMLQGAGHYLIGQ